MDIDNVSWSEVIAAARLRRASLVPESAGYLMLGLIRAIGGRPLQVAPSRILLSTEGAVTLASPCRRVSPNEAAQTLQRILHELLSVSQEKATALRVIADGETPRLERLFSAVTKALIPINRAAARRALARLARETVRARQRGQLRPEDLPSDEELLAATAEAAPAAPSLTPTTPDAPACEPTYQDLSTQIELATPTPEPTFRPATVVSFELALEDIDQPSPSAPSVCTAEYGPRDTMRDPIPAVRVAPAMERIVTPAPVEEPPEPPVLDPGVGATRPLELPEKGDAAEVQPVEAQAVDTPPVEAQAVETQAFETQPVETQASEVQEDSSRDAAAPEITQPAEAVADEAPARAEELGAPGATPLMAMGVQPTQGAPISAPSASHRGGDAPLASMDGEVRAVGPSVVVDEPASAPGRRGGEVPEAPRSEEHLAAPIPLTVHADEALEASELPRDVRAEPSTPAEDQDELSLAAPAAGSRPEEPAAEEPAPTTRARRPERGTASAEEVADELGLAERLKGKVARLPAARRRHGSALLGRSPTVEDLLEDFADDGDTIGAVTASLKSMMELSPTPPPGTTLSRGPAPAPASDTVSGLALERDVLRRAAEEAAEDEVASAPPEALHDEDELERTADETPSAISAQVELTADEPASGRGAQVELTAASEPHDGREEREAPAARETRPDGTLPDPAPGVITPRAFFGDDGDEDEAVPSVSPPPVASESHDDDSVPPPSEELPERPRRGRLVAGVVAVAAVAAGVVAVQQQPELLDRAEAIAAPVLERVLPPEEPAGQCLAHVRLAELPSHHEVLSFLGTTPLRTGALPQGVRLELMVTASGRLPERIVIPADATWSPEGQLRLAVELEEGAGTHWPSAPAGTVGGTGPAGHIAVDSAHGPAEVWLVIASGEGADHVVPLPCDETARLLVVDTDAPSRQRRIEVGADLLGTAARAGGADVAARP